MSAYQEDPTPPETPAERAVAKAEAAATRRRWLTLAEVVAIAGVVIAGLTLWNNWQGRQAEQAQQQAQEASAASAAKSSAAVLLTGTPAHDGDLALADPAHNVQSIDVRFPAKLGIAAKNSLLDPRIDADWFAGKLLAMTDGGADDVQGRLPVIITSDYWVADQHHSDSAIYDIVWQTEGRMLRGRALKLKGIVLHQRHGATQTALDALWAKEAPKPKG